MIQSIIKRDGRVVLYDQNKIAAAILKALEASGDGNAADAARVANDVQLDLETRFPAEAPNIEAIQDAVERQLMNHGFNAAAKAYILYRANRTRAREAGTSLMKTIDEITNIDARISDMKRDNANIDGNTAMGSMLQIGSAGAKAYNEIYLEVYDAQNNERRSVTTLSGGEKFLVALSLAIGLSTVVQAQGHGMRLEAMFIDEGFGSLDRESIADALEVLQGIQRSHGIVGIISHVEQLSEIIPTRLEITKGKQGSICHIRN